MFLTVSPIRWARRNPSLPRRPPQPCRQLSLTRFGLARSSQLTYRATMPNPMSHQKHPPRHFQDGVPHASEQAWFRRAVQKPLIHRRPCLIPSIVESVSMAWDDALDIPFSDALRVPAHQRVIRRCDVVDQPSGPYRRWMCTSGEFSRQDADI